MAVSERSRRVGIFLVLVVGVSLVTGWLCAQSRPEDLRPAISAQFAAVRWIQVDTLARWLRSEVPPTLLDARAPEEFAVSHLQGARRVDPDHPDLDALVELRSRRVVVYCSVGYRSADIAQQLARAGFNNVYNLEGGIFAWANRGHPIYARGRRVHKVHPYDTLWGRYLRPELRSTTVTAE